MSAFVYKALVASLAFCAVQAAPAVPRADGSEDNTELLANMLSTPSTIKRWQQLFTKDGKELLDPASLAEAAVYDFAGEPNQNTPAIPGGQGGVAYSANVQTFPFLLGSGMTITHGVLGPCGIVVPHVHPRANEFFIVADGEVTTGVTLEMGLLEAGSPEITLNLKKDHGTMFPQGAIHYQINDSPECKPASIWVILSSEDAGTTGVIQDPTRGNSTAVKRTAGRADFESIKPILPSKIVKAAEQCLNRCNVA